MPNHAKIKRRFGQKRPETEPGRPEDDPKAADSEPSELVDGEETILDALTDSFRWRLETESSDPEADSTDYLETLGDADLDDSDR